uniref:Uncharacterized protein n=1 Tax=Anguilla anguilla TaxID=7936 RepID=A0A0E9Q1G9_ANGAN
MYLFTITQKNVQFRMLGFTDVHNCLIPQIIFCKLQYVSLT